MKKIALAACIWAAALGPVLAQDMSVDQMGKPDRSRVASGSYTLDTHHTHIVYKVDHFGISSYYGLFGGLTGELTLDAARPEISKVSVTIPLDKVLSATLALDAHLKTEDFFDVSRFPAARFTSTKIIPADDGSARIIGNLDLHGRTRPVELKGRFVGAAVHPMTGLATVGFEASGTIRRSDFGIDYIVPFISDEIELTITTAFEKAD